VHEPRRLGLRGEIRRRAGRDHTHRFPQLVEAIASLSPGHPILDGEVCIFDDRLISRFECLRARPTDETATPPIFMAFNCLWANGHDLRTQALHARRDQLEQMVEGQDLLLPARRLADDALKAWQQVVESGYEGLVHRIMNSFRVFRSSDERLLSSLSKERCAEQPHVLGDRNRNGAFDLPLLNTQSSNASAAFGPHPTPR